MKKISPPLFLELRKTANHLVLGWLMTRRDGQRIGFTSGDLPFTYDGVTYEPTNAFSGMAASSKSNLAVDNSSAVALLTDKITERDLMAGLYDNATVQLFWIDPNHPEWGTVPIRGGRLGEIVVRGNQFETELRSVFQRLQQPFGDVYTLECQTDLGSDRCKVQLDCPVWEPRSRKVAGVGDDAGIGSMVRPTAQNGYWYRCVSANGAASVVESLSNRAVYRTGVNNKFEGATGVFQVLGERLDASKTAWATMEGVASPDLGFWRITNKETLAQVGTDRYADPTRIGEVPPQAPAGTAPLMITNGSAIFTYAIGLTGETEPDWPTEEGATVADGQLVWRCVRARRLRGRVTSVFNRGQFYDASRDEPMEYWKYGVLTWLTGANGGLRSEVREYLRGAGGGFSLLEQMPGRIRPGDEYEVVAGCAKTRTACKTFDNIRNFRGFPDMPTEDKALATPDAHTSGKKKKKDGGGS